MKIEYCLTYFNSLVGSLQGGGGGGGCCREGFNINALRIKYLYALVGYTEQVSV